MKKPEEVKAIISATVYTVPTYSNVDGEIINGKNTTIKFYNELSSIANAGVKPLSLVKILIDYYDTKDKVEELDDMASAMLSRVYDVIQEMEENEK